MKAYVKVYEGYQVPEGATHFSFETKNEHAAFWGADCMWVVFGGNAEEYKADSIPKDAIELPEATQEWNGEGLPPVGCECEIKCFYKSGSGWKKCYIVGSTKDDNHLVVHTYYDDELNFAVKHTGDVKFRPLKTQQEKDREALYLAVIDACTPIHKDDFNIDEIVGALFHAGFTAPKADEE
jgi:hypothetical protein